MVSWCSTRIRRRKTSCARSGASASLRRRRVRKLRRRSPYRVASAETKLCFGVLGKGFESRGRTQPLDPKSAFARKVDMVRRGYFGPILAAPHSLIAPRGYTDWAAEGGAVLGRPQRGAGTAAPYPHSLTHRSYPTVPCAVAAQGSVSS